MNSLCRKLFLAYKMALLRVERVQKSTSERELGQFGTGRKVANMLNLDTSVDIEPPQTWCTDGCLISLIELVTSILYSPP